MANPVKESNYDEHSESGSESSYHTAMSGESCYIPDFFIFYSADGTPWILPLDANTCHVDS